MRRPYLLAPGGTLRKAKIRFCRCQEGLEVSATAASVPKAEIFLHGIKRGIGEQNTLKYNDISKLYALIATASVSAKRLATLGSS